MVIVSKTIHDYIVAHSVREPASLAAIRQSTATHPYAYMQMPAESGAISPAFVATDGGEALH